jgi:hypothetical protein
MIFNCSVSPSGREGNKFGNLGKAQRADCGALVKVYFQNFRKYTTECLLHLYPLLSISPKFRLVKMLSTLQDPFCSHAHMHGHLSGPV